MTELRIRVKPLVKKRLEELKEKTGLSMNYYVNYAIVKQLILDSILKTWEYDNITRQNPHYENINKLPEDLKFCDGDRCELPFSEKSVCSYVEKHTQSQEQNSCTTDSKIRGEKC